MKTFVRSGVKQKICLIILFVVFSSCAVSQDTESLVITPSTPDYATYIKMVQKKVQSSWKFPSGLSGTQTVTLRIVLDIDGKLVAVDVVNSTDPRLDGPAVDAVKRASPFPPISEDIKRLAGEPMLIKFTVTTKSQQS